MSDEIAKLDHELNQTIGRRHRTRKETRDRFPYGTIQ